MNTEHLWNDPVMARLDALAVQKVLLFQEMYFWLQSYELQAKIVQVPAWLETAAQMVRDGTPPYRATEMARIIHGVGDNDD